MDATSASDSQKPVPTSAKMRILRRIAIFAVLLVIAIIVAWFLGQHGDATIRQLRRNAVQNIFSRRSVPNVDKIELLFINETLFFNKPHSEIKGILINAFGAARLMETGTLYWDVPEESDISEINLADHVRLPIGSDPPGTTCSVWIDYKPNWFDRLLSRLGLDNNR